MTRRARRAWPTSTSWWPTGDAQGRDDGARALPGPRAALAAGGRARRDGAPLPRDAEEYLSWLEVERGRSPRTLAAYRRDLAAYEASLEAASGHGDRPRPRPPTWRPTWPRCGPRTARPRWPAPCRASAASTASWSRRGCAATTRPLDLPSISVTDLLPKALSEEETERLLGAVVGHRPDGAARPGPARGPLRRRAPG